MRYEESNYRPPPKALNLLGMNPFRTETTVRRRIKGLEKCFLYLDKSLFLIEGRYRMNPVVVI